MSLASHSSLVKRLNNGKHLEMIYYAQGTPLIADHLLEQEVGTIITNLNSKKIVAPESQCRRVVFKSGSLPRKSGVSANGPSIDL